MIIGLLTWRSQNSLKILTELSMERAFHLVRQHTGWWMRTWAWWGHHSGYPLPKSAHPGTHPLDHLPSYVLLWAC